MKKAAALPPPLKVILVDDHTVVRQGLKTILERARCTVVAEAATVIEAISAVQAYPDADVMVLDVHLPDGGGHTVLEQLGDRAPATLAVSASDERKDVIATVSAGSTGYILKNVPEQMLVDAVKATAEGHPVFSPELAGHLLHLDIDLQQHVVNDEWESLSEREREVLRHLASGKTYKKIGETLHVAPKTVETHVRHILRKLHVENRHEAARWAASHGFDL